MSLTTEQLVVLRDYILAAPDLATIPNSLDGSFAIAEMLQLPAIPEVIVWRTSVPQDEIMTNGFDWVRVDNLSIGKARIWEWLFKNESRTINPSKPNVRAGVDEVWKGTTADLAVRAAVYVHLKRPANRLEAVFAVGAGTSVDPATMVVEGQISYQEVGAARNL